jgi:hypothetical protein
MTRKSVWANADGLRVGFGPNFPDFSSVAEHKTEGVDRELRLIVDGEKFSGGIYQFDATEALPVGAVPLYAHARVSEVFVLGGTTPTIQIGSTGSTGGVANAPSAAVGSAAILGSLSEANAEALGTYTLSITATPLTATTAGNLQVTLGGTTPTVTAAGKVAIVIGYRVVNA